MDEKQKQQQKHKNGPGPETGRKKDIMKKFKVEVKERGFLKPWEQDNLEYYDPFDDYLMAEDEDDALDLAKYLLHDMVLMYASQEQLEEIEENGGLKECIDRHWYEITEIEETEIED